MKDTICQRSTIMSCSAFRSGHFKSEPGNTKIIPAEDVHVIEQSSEFQALSFSKEVLFIEHAVVHLISFISLMIGQTSFQLSHA